MLKKEALGYAMRGSAVDKKKTPKDIALSAAAKLPLVKKDAKSAKGEAWYATAHDRFSILKHGGRDGVFPSRYRAS